MIPGIERIVVVLDAAAENRTAIDTAARLAARWKVPLHGVFVEDDDLIRLANLPFARQVTLLLGVEPINREQAERQMRAYAEQARRDLAAGARHQGVAWTFEVVRGGSGTPLGAGSHTDFLVCSTMTRPIGGHFRVECRWWSSGFASHAASFLLAHRDRREGMVAALVSDLDPASERLLAAAARLAEANGSGLTVICPPELANGGRFESWLDRVLAAHPVGVEVALAPAEPAALLRQIVELDCRVVVVGSGAAEAQPARLREMVAQIACDVLVVQ